VTYQIVYSSQASESLTPDDLEALLSSSRAANDANDITGALVYVDGIFLQFLEGDKDVLADLVDRIEKDPRHSLFKVFFEAEATERTFGSWKMAYVDAKPEQVAIWAGLPGTTSIQAIVDSVDQNPQQLAKFAAELLRVLT
jgi:Sensors of blue-light using FAD